MNTRWYLTRHADCILLVVEETDGERRGYAGEVQDRHQAHRMLPLLRGTLAAALAADPFAPALYTPTEAPMQ